jgi:hypothetical protein
VVPEAGFTWGEAYWVGRRSLAATLNAMELVADELGLGAYIEPLRSAWNVPMRVSQGRWTAFVMARLKRV